LTHFGGELKKKKNTLQIKVSVVLDLTEESHTGLELYDSFKLQIVCKSIIKASI